MKTKLQKRDETPDEQDVSQDPVWALLRHSPSSSVSAGFADRVVIAARHADAATSLFGSRTRWIVSTVAGMAAAVAIGCMVAFLPDPAPVFVQHAHDSSDAFATLDEVASQEMLLAATDHLTEFSDTELVSLIGF